MRFSLLFVSIGIACVAQIFFKKGAVEMAGISSFLSRNIMIGLGLYAVSTVFYLNALRTIPLSVAYPMIALSYVIVVLVGKFYLGETLSNVSVMGVCLILTGVVLLGYGARFAS